MEKSVPNVLFIYKGRKLAELSDGTRVFAVHRQQHLEESVKHNQASEKLLLLIQDSLLVIDRHLSTYISDHIKPDHIQEIRMQLEEQESRLAHMWKKNEQKFVPERIHLQMDVILRLFHNVYVKLRFFQNPGSFEERLAECERVLREVTMQLSVLVIRSAEKEVLHSQLEQCNKSYDVLCRIKPEVEILVKTGRLTVRREQTEGPDELDDRLTALRRRYNDLGVQVSREKVELEKSLFLSQKLWLEVNNLTEWLAMTDAELTCRSNICGIPKNLDAEVSWAMTVQKETEQRRQQQLQCVIVVAETLMALLQGKDGLVENKIQLLNCNWTTVKSHITEWLHLLLECQRGLRSLDQSLSQINTWMDQTEILLKVKCPRNLVLQILQEELNDIHKKVKMVKTEIQNLIQLCGVHCWDLMEPKLYQLSRRLKEISQGSRNNTVLSLHGKYKALTVAPRWYQYHRPSGDLQKIRDSVQQFP